MGTQQRLERAREISTRYRALKLGLVDASVIAVAERLGAGATRPVRLPSGSAETPSQRPLSHKPKFDLRRLAAARRKSVRLP